MQNRRQHCSQPAAETNNRMSGGRQGLQRSVTSLSDWFSAPLIIGLVIVTPSAMANRQAHDARRADTTSAANTKLLPLTGERTVPDLPEENYWFRRHEVAYEYALALVAGRRVLEIGCGEGYGAALLAAVASEVVGVDYDTLTIAHAAARYPQARFVRANLAALPVPDASIDVVATLQVIEHVWHHPQFVRECARVLRPGGLLLVTTPNRLTFSPGLDAPVNPFHTVEFTSCELSALLTGCGLEVAFAGGLHAGERLVKLDAAHGGSFVEAQLRTPPDGWSAQLRADVAATACRDFIVLDGPQRDVDAALDLVTLATKPSAPARALAGSPA